MVVLLWAGRPGVVAAQAEPTRESEPVQHLEEVVVSATKTPLPVSQVTSAVEVITGKELEGKKVKTVVDAFRLAQGLAVFSNGGPGSNATVRMRGAFSRHTLVVIDGVIVNSPTSGDFNFANLTTENIERIEILRGAQSMLWGSDAVGGVISIVTKRGRDRPTASAYVEYGSFATIREGAEASGVKGPFDFALAVSRWDTSNFSAINYRRGAAERDGFHNWNASARLGVALPRDTRLELDVRWWQSLFNTDDFAGNGAPADGFGSRQRTRTLILSGKLEQPVTSWWSHKLTVGRGNEHIVGSNGPLARNLDTGQLIPSDPDCGFPTPAANCFFPFRTNIEFLNHRLEWQHNLEVTKAMLLTAGYQFREEQGDNPDAFGGSQPNRINSSHAGFAQAQLNLFERLLVTSGLRQDRYNLFGDATTYRVGGGVLISETGTKLRASYSTGFRAPTLNDLFFQSPFFVGNPNLKPEKSQSWDAGIDQRLLGGRLVLSAGYFWNRFRNLVAADPVTFITLVNIGLAASKGWELGCEFELTKQLSARGQYTYTLTRDLHTGRRLPRWPVDQASLGLSYQPMDPVRINFDYRFVGARLNNTSNTQRQGSFGVVNFAATYDVSKRMQVFGRIDNVLDQRYEEILFFGTPGRSVYVGLRVNYDTKEQ